MFIRLTSDSLFSHVAPSHPSPLSSSPFLLARYPLFLRLTGAPMIMTKATLQAPRTAFNSPTRTHQDAQ